MPPVFDYADIMGTVIEVIYDEPSIVIDKSELKSLLDKNLSGNDKKVLTFEKGYVMVSS